MGKNRLWPTVPKKRGHATPRRAAGGSTQVPQEGEGDESLCRGFHGRRAGDWLVWIIRTIAEHCLAPGCGRHGRGHSGRCESP